MDFKHFLAFISTIMIFGMIAYLLFASRISVLGAVGLIIGTGIYTILVLNTDAVSSLAGSWGSDRSLRIEMTRLKEDVYARADFVKHLGEEMARFAAHTVATANRFVGDDHTANMLKEREKIKELMANFKSEDSKIAETLHELDQMVIHDLKGEVQAEASRLIASLKYTSKKPVNELHREIKEHLDGYSGPHSRSALETYLKSIAAFNEKVSERIDKLDRFILEKRL